MLAWSKFWFFSGKIYDLFFLEGGSFFVLIARVTTFPVGGISGGKTKMAEKRHETDEDEDLTAKNRPKKKT